MNRAIAIALVLAAVLAAANVRAAPTWSYGDPTPEEQLMLELINRARADPERERQRLGVSASEWPVYAPQPPLVMSTRLLQAARGHAEDMHDRGYFSHLNPDGVNANGRLRAAGYPLAAQFGGDDVNQVENIAAGYATARIANDELMIDEGTVPPNHRRLILADSSFWERNDEIGVGIHRGNKGYGSYYAQEIAHDDDPVPHVLGVVYRDNNENGYYDVREGIGGVRIATADGAYSTTTASAGGYGFRADVPGSYVLRATGPDFEGAFEVPLVVGVANVKVDFVLDQIPPIEITRSKFKLNLVRRKKGDDQVDRLLVKARPDPSRLPIALDGAELTVRFGELTLGPYALDGKGKHRSARGELPKVRVKVNAKKRLIVVRIARADLLSSLSVQDAADGETREFEIHVTVGAIYDATEAVTLLLRVKDGKLISAR